MVRQSTIIFFKSIKMDEVGKADVKIIYKMHTYFLRTQRLIQFS